MPVPVFVTRRFPPSVGGMETLAAGVWRSIRSAKPDAVLIAHGADKRGLLQWFPKALFRLFRLAVNRQIEFVLAGDALTYAVVSIFLRPFGLPCFAMAMGLDITYPNPFYRWLTHPPLRRAQAVIAISSATAEEVRRAGVAPTRIIVVRPGVPVPPFNAGDRMVARAALHKRLGIPPGASLIGTLGRLVERKGIGWFVRSVLSQLPSTVHYVVAGDGPDAETISAASDAQGLSNRVHMLGRVNDDVREEILRGVDIFVQPNVAVPGDLEGFGLVTIEAALRGTPVVASSLEGLRDAIVDGETGIFVAAGDASAWSEKLEHLLSAPSRLVALGADFRQSAAQIYHEEAMASALWKILRLGEPLSDDGDPSVDSGYRVNTIK